MLTIRRRRNAALPSKLLFVLCTLQSGRVHNLRAEIFGCEEREREDVRLDARPFNRHIRLPLLTLRDMGWIESIESYGGSPSAG